MNKNYIVFCNEYIYTDYLSVLNGIEKYIKCFITNNIFSTDGIDCFDMSQFGKVTSSIDDNTEIVVFKNMYVTDKIYKYLEINYNIISGSNWLAMMLKEHKDIVIKPTKLRIDICTLCQIDCADCYMRKGNYGSVGAGYMTFKQFKRVVDDAPYIKEIEISNSGEPLLNPDLVKILEYSYNNNIKITIGNGTNFNTASNELLEALVKYNVRNVLMSIDGASQETYAKYRRKGNFNKIIENIKKVNEYKEKYNSDYPKMIYKCILFTHNEHEIEKVIELANELKCEVRFWPPWSKDQFIAKDPQRVFELTGIDFRDNKEPELYYDYCLQMILSPQINWDGKILGCCINYLKEWDGNVFEDGLVNAINTEGYRNAICRFFGGEFYESEDQCTLYCNDYKNFIQKGVYVDL